MALTTRPDPAPDAAVPDEPPPFDLAEADAAAALVAHPDDRLELRDPAIGDLGLSGDEWAAIVAIAAGATVGSLAAALGLRPAETGFVLLGLQALGVVVVVPSDPDREIATEPAEVLSTPGPAFEGLSPAAADALRLVTGPDAEPAAWPVRLVEFSAPTPERDRLVRWLGDVRRAGDHSGPGDRP